MKDFAMKLSRRQFIAAAGATSLLTLWPGTSSFAASGDTRLLVLLLRGGLDGLHAMPPLAESGYASARGALVPNDALNSGWDTHGNQAGLLGHKLSEFDNALRAYRDGMGTQWNRTAVLVVTEFGRTVAVNGTGGTDHGTGGVAFLAGGGVRGGRIAGDWPGLAPSNLHEGRDLRTTTDMRALFKGVLGTHLGISESALESRIFPDSRDVRPMPGLIA